MSKFFPGFVESDMKVSDDISIHYEMGGSGDPVLLVHGYPENHLTWHKIAPELAKKYTVVCPDLRGYGDSSCPNGGMHHENYTKHVMAEDLVKLMSNLGFERFKLCGHDRGARVSWRMTLDFTDHVEKAIFLDIAPECELYDRLDFNFCKRYFHMFFLIRPDIPEALIGSNPGGWFRNFFRFYENKNIYDPEIVADYARCLSKAGVIHGTCEDYRSSAGDELMEQLRERAEGIKIKVPLRVLIGGNGLIAGYKPHEMWPNWADNVEIKYLDGVGHFVPEEGSREVLQCMEEFF